MYWLDDEDGNLVNIEQARNIAVHPVEPEEAHNSYTHAVIATFSSGEEAWLFSGKEDACIEFRNGLRRALKRADSSKPGVEYLFPEMHRG